ncbi:hypothetical protein [Variovorax sp. LT1R16]|uniref:hypothetical protein n=1 Tax=Variovorax sp. LT1R16 TaxID=3443728 RepID=UPI003F44D8EC
MPSTDKLTEAYEAWKRMNDEHAEMMRNVTSGAKLDAEAMTQKVGELDVLHATWMDMVMRREGRS